MHQALLVTMAVVDQVEVITLIQLLQVTAVVDQVEYQHQEELLQQVEMV
jgi:hypothetical protein